MGDRLPQPHALDLEGVQQKLAKGGSDLIPVVPGLGQIGGLVQKRKQEPGRGGEIGCLHDVFHASVTAFLTDDALTDLDLVIADLLDAFGSRPVILVGHSWGSALGLLYAQAHPEVVTAFVGVGQVTSEIARRRSQYRFVKAEAARRGEADRRARIEAIGPPPFTVEGELAILGFVERYGGYWRNPPRRFPLLVRAGLRGYVMPWELPRLIRGNNVSLRAMHDELLELDLRTRVRSVHVPVVFMLGRYDKQVDSALADPQRAVRSMSIADPRVRQLCDHRPRRAM